MQATRPTGEEEVRRGDSTPVEVAVSEHRRITEAFITACANGDLQALTALLDPTVWGVGTVLADPAPPPQVNHGPHDVAANLMRYLGGRRRWCPGRPATRCCSPSTVAGCSP